MQGNTKHWRLSVVLFRYETFINFVTLVFRHEERETQFLLYDPTNALRIPWPPRSLSVGICRTPWSYPPAGLARCRVKSQLTSFSKSPNSLPIASGHDVINTPVPFSYLGFLLWHLWLSYPLRASVNTWTKSRMVQSPTKPNDKI